MTKILATLDGSPISRAILPVLGQIARAMDADVELLTVVNQAESTPITRPEEMTPKVDIAGLVTPPTMQADVLHTQLEARYAESREQAVQRLEHEGSEFLAEEARSLKAQGLRVQERVVMDDDPARAIIDFAKREGVDMIAMATHGRTGLREVVQGSVAEAVVKSGVAPVLLVRPTAEE